MSSEKKKDFNLIDKIQKDSESDITVDDAFFEKENTCQNTLNLKTPLRGRAAFTGKSEDDTSSLSINNGSIHKNKLENGSYLKDNNQKSSRIGWNNPEDKKKILVVEDDDNHSNVLDVILKGANYAVSLASNGVEALKYLENNRADLIICDLMMPKMSGSEFVSTIRRDAKFLKIPIIMLTVITDPEKEYALLDMGADDYCEKTVKRKVLLKRIEKLLERHSSD